MKKLEKIAKKNYVTWFNGYVSRKDREKLHGHKGAVIWFTGLSASGKSTIAHLVEKELHRQGCSTYVFDGDNVRHGLCSDLTFSSEHREENVRRIGEMVKLFVDAGIIAITAFISPYRKDRQKLRSLFSGRQFLEIHVDCPPELCAERDKKGIYAKAKAGVIKEFTGISAPYEPPENPDLVIPSYRQGAREAAECVVCLIRQRNILHSPDSGHSKAKIETTQKGRIAILPPRADLISCASSLRGIGPAGRRPERQKQQRSKK
jgi:adenylylsulfate kinase